MKFEKVGRNLSGGTVTGMHACTGCPDGGPCVQGSMHTVICQHIMGIVCHLRSGMPACLSGAAGPWGSRGAIGAISRMTHIDELVQRTARAVDVSHASPHPEVPVAILSQNERRGGENVQQVKWGIPPIVFPKEDERSVSPYTQRYSAPKPCGHQWQGVRRQNNGII